MEVKKKRSDFYIPFLELVSLLDCFYQLIWFCFFIIQSELYRKDPKSYDYVQPVILFSFHLFIQQPNTNFLRKIPKDSHVANIMVGEVEDLPSRVVGFMRLKEPRVLQNDLSEVNIPTRFVFFCLGRRGEEEELIEFGRCMGTMMVDDVRSRSVERLF